VSHGRPRATGYHERVTVRAGRSLLTRGSGGTRPISRGGRLIVAACLLLAAVVLGFAASIALYQFNRDLVRSSEGLGRLLCGEGQHVDDVPTRPRGTRMICRDAAGVEVSARNNLIAVKMALPFVLVIAVPALWFARAADIRESRQR
jgi:hypothetical protein